MIGWWGSQSGRGGVARVLGGARVVETFVGDHSAVVPEDRDDILQRRNREARDEMGRLVDFKRTHQQ